MTYTFQDQDLLLWEAYVATVRAGGDGGAKIVFHCLTDRTRRARVLMQDEARAATTKRLSDLDATDLAELLAAAEPLE